MGPHILFFAAALAASGPAGAQTPNVEPGQWRFESRVQFSGDFQMPEQTNEAGRCLTREEIERGAESMVGDPQNQCEVAESEVSASGMRYTLRCAAGGREAMTMTGEMSFHGDRIEGTSSGEIQAAGRTMRMEMQMRGERVGDC